MAILKILQYPDERLHTVAVPVVQVTDKIRSLIQNMAETMYAAPGIGLAATQVDVHQRIIVIDTSETHDQLLVLIKRAEAVTVKAFNAEGESFVLDANGLLAICIQHEMDHLVGKVFVEYWSQLKQIRTLAKLKKKQRSIM